MTILPFYEARVLEMSLESYAKIAIDSGIWLTGELLARQLSMGQYLPTEEAFVPDLSNIHRPQHPEAVLSTLHRVDEALRHRIFIEGFLMRPANGAQATFEQLRLTHAEMLHDAFRLEWERRCRRMCDVGKRHDNIIAVANELLHKLIPSR